MSKSMGILWSNRERLSFCFHMESASRGNRLAGDRHRDETNVWPGLKSPCRPPSTELPPYFPSLPRSSVSKIIYLYSRNIFFWKKNAILNQVLSRMDENQSFNPFIELAMGRAHRVKNVCCLTSIRLNMISKFPFQHLLESLIYFPRRPRWN